MSKLVRFHPGTVGARLGGFFARAVGAGTATLHALAQGYEASLYKAQEHQRTRALERRSGMLGISPEWYEAIAEEVGEHTLMEKAADIARAGTTRGRGGVPDWIGLTEDPYEPLTGFGGYRERPAILSYDMLTTLSRRVGPFTGYLQTRMNQLTYYADPQEDKHGPGYVVRKRGGKKEGRGEDKKARKYEEILRSSGPLETYDERTGNRRPGMLEFLKLFLRDSLIYDQAHIESRRTRGKDLVAWRSLSASSIRQARPDDDVRNSFGELVRYVQIVDGVVAAEFSPRDLSFSIRNPRNDLRVFGYGYSELEMMISTVTALLSGISHNANFFEQGTSAKGVLAVSGLVPRAQMRAFRRKWTAMVTGAQNAWRAPILEVTDLEGKGGGLKWIDIQKSNLDMEWSNFMDWLLRVMCSVLQIAPEEINFQLGNRGQTSTLNEGNQAQKIEASQDRGLRPTLKWAAQQINEHVLWRIDPNYELAFEGLDARSELQEVELLTKEVAAYLMVDEAREARNLPPLPEDKGQIILSPTYIQSVQNAAMAEQQQSMMGAEGEAGEEGEEGDAPSGGFAGVDGFGGFAAQGGEPAEKSLTGPARLRRLRGQNSVVYEVDL